MKNKNKILVGIVVVIALLIGIGYYLITPEEKIDLNTNAELITTEELIKGSFIGYGEILTNPLRLKGEMSFTNQEFKNILYTIMMKNDLKEFSNVNIDINTDKIRVILPYNILGIDTLIKINIEPSIENNNLHITLVDSKIGKIQISDKILGRLLENFKDKLPYKVENNKIIIDKESILPIILDEVNIKNNKLVIKVEVKAKNILEFIKENKIKVK